MQKLDNKYTAIVVKDSTGEIVPCDEFIIMRAKDDAFLDAMNFYYDRCNEMGAALSHLEAIADVINRAELWRKRNKDKCQIPTTEPHEIQ